ncbi:MAG: OmpH family outer membrane protein [Treponema sp.]|nr:OmpH family outer membrane protein [Treponema sp.]
MNKTKKIILIAISVFMFVAVQGFSQQITKFGVVDTSKVYSAYFKDSSPVRNYDAKKKEFQNEITKRADEIKKLKQKKLEYEKNGDNTNAQKVALDITKKTEFLTEYTNAKNAELEAMLANMQRADDFYKKLYKVLAKVAESGGYSMILSLQENNSILWYSSSVDVTDQVINELGK